MPFVFSSIPLIFRFVLFLAATQLSLLASPAVEGVVLDATHSPIPGARVSVSSALSTTTSAEGKFSLALPMGSHQITISADGFLPQTLSLSAPAAPQTITLQIREQSTSVTVTEAPAYQTLSTATATKTPTLLRDLPQSITLINHDQIRDQLMLSMADATRYVPGITMAQGEGHRDAPVIRGNATTADFYVNGVRDDVQYLRDLYNLERVEAVKGPNAMIFGRGGGGGVINRVTKDAGFTPFREVTLQGGTFGNKRFSTDLNQPLNEKIALRLNALYENSNNFRNYFNLERYGLAPTISFALKENTRLRLAYEYFRDTRLTDRGLPSFQGRPAVAHRSTFFGNPTQSPADAGVHLGSASLEHQRGRLNLKNTTLFGAYDKFYQNVFPGVLNADATLVSLSGYNIATQRNNVFNQSDATYQLKNHTLLIGAELGRQATDNRRETGYFNNLVTTINVPFRNPTDYTPVTWRQSPTDNYNHATNTIAATYIQDQIRLSRYFQVLAGIRFDRFNLSVNNLRSNERLSRTDNIWSPRAGIIFKPITAMSIYANYSIAYLPSAGDQFASLDATTQALKPERFTNYETGLKWDLKPTLSFTASVYRLNRTNTRSVDPNNPALILQTGSQRSEGLEIGLNGAITRRWTVAGGYANQDAFITNPTAAARLGAKVALVPAHTFSMWNHYRLLPKLSAGLGLIHQAEMFAGFDNTVKLPQFTRADAALYYSLTERIRLQANIENVANITYFPTAHSNTNISPGSPRVLRLALTYRF
jgi:catecholate siderophore receptor